jgi:hypothetical protein
VCALPTALVNPVQVPINEMGRPGGVGTTSERVRGGMGMVNRMTMRGLPLVITLI